MFTIGEYANRAMVYAYRDMRAAGIIPTGYIPEPLTIDQNNELHTFIVIEVARMANNTPGFAMHLVPFIESLAYAIAQTEQYPMSSDRYCAWLDYEKHLHTLAINANR